MGHLQRGTDPESLLFRKIAEQGHYAGFGPPKHTGTRQGTYATAPSGVLLASINSNDPVRMVDMLSRALDVWDSLPPEERLIAQDPDALSEQVRSARAESFYPDGGLALRVHTRDLPRHGGTAQRTGDWRETALNRDFAWFTRDEARQMVPENALPGASHAVPEPLLRRLARLHFVDNVRGQTPPFRNEDVEVAELTSEVTSLDGQVVQVKFRGHVRISAEGVWPIDDSRDAQNPQLRHRGFDACLIGSGVWDSGQQRFAAFDLLAVGPRWGGTQYNRRHDDLDPAPMGIALTLAGDTYAERVAPANFWGYGWR